MISTHSFVLAVLLLALSPVVCWSQDISYDLDGGIIEQAVKPKIWERTFAAGLNGKTGNSENLDINMNLNMTRTSDSTTTKLQASYFYSTNDVATTTDRFLSLGRHEIDFARNPRWGWFFQGTLEADRFKAYDYLLGLHSGLSFKVFEVDDGFFKLRAGAGASRQVGGVNDDWIPELQFGADWERKLSDHAKAYASVDFFPNVSDFSDHRLLTNAGFEFVIDKALNLNFRIFALNRYDSTPEPGNQDNDLDYGMAIVYGF